MQNKDTKHKGRIFFPPIAHEVLSKFLLIIHLSASPAFLSCSEKDMTGNDMQEESVIELSSKAFTTGGTLDLFVFDTDALARLDSRMRVICNGSLPERIPVSSRSGHKRVVALANWSENEPAWEKVNSFSALCRMMVPLTTDNPLAPRMSGSMVINTGGTASTKLSLTTLSAKIRLASIRCDFTGKPYQGSILKDARVYLTNVCTNSSPFPENYPGSEFINVGGYSMADLEAFGAKDLLSRKIFADIGPEIVKTGIDFYCYSNYCSEEGCGMPPTRLVLEGQLNGKTVYYPVNLGDYTGGAVRGGYTYVIDLKITQYGTDDPDTPVSGGTLESSIRVIPWEQKDPETIDY